MKALKFTLSGTTAFFKKPDVNTYFYFTYGHIHKIALLGMLGAVVGYGGYNHQNMNNLKYPEFYEKLKDVKISIIPSSIKKFSENQQKGYFTKKIQTFNNTVGYANIDGNLIVKEQWIENPCWQIYLMIKSSKEQNITDYIINSKTVFIPYLGKNDHLANIDNGEIVEIKDIEINKPINIDSLYIKDFFKFHINEENKYSADVDCIDERIFKYEERLPVYLEETSNQYETSTFIYTNSKLIQRDYSQPLNEMVYKCGEETIFFF